MDYGQTIHLQGMNYWDLPVPIVVQRTREAYYLPQHTHDFIELHYVAEGKGVHYIDDRAYETEQSDIFVIPVGTKHVYRPTCTEEKDKLIVYNCFFAEELLESWIPGAPFPNGWPGWLSRQTSTYRHLKDARSEIRPLFEAIFREYILRMPGCEVMLYSRLMQLLVELYRSGLHDRRTNQHQRLEPLLIYIDQHYAENITLEHASRMIHVSVSYLQRLFKRSTGQAFTEYVQNVRMAKCCELLQKTSINVRDIAFKVGYQDMKFFHELFKRKTGCTPHQYRKAAMVPAVRAGLPGSD